VYLPRLPYIVAKVEVIVAVPVSSTRWIHVVASCRMLSLKFKIRDVSNLVERFHCNGSS
jgi:hypothetical protein